MASPSQRRTAVLPEKVPCIAHRVVWFRAALDHNLKSGDCIANKLDNHADDNGDSKVLIHMTEAVVEEAHHPSA